MSMLQWDLTQASKDLLAKQGKLREHYDLDNHLCDAFLYLWRFSNHFWGAPKQKAMARPIYDLFDEQEAAWEARYVRERDQPQDHLSNPKFDQRSGRDPLRRYYR